MSYKTQPEPSTSRARARSAGRALLLVSCLALTTTPLPCEERVLVGGLLDAEVWQTDDASLMLSRNEGDAASAGRLRLWAASEFLPRLQGFVMGCVEDGNAYSDEAKKTDLEQAFLRYSFQPPLRLTIEAGQMTTPVGNFSRRYTSDLNPLVGSPDSYSVYYPLGVKVTGQTTHFDYRLAVVDRAMVNENYSPEPGRAVRPMLSLGVTPMVGLRFAPYVTRGPYMGPQIQEMLPAGTAWKDLDQTIYGLDAQFSRGHFELNADYTASIYDHPTGGHELRGRVYFIEPKYTWTPRFFTALRFERNDYPYIMPLFPGTWIASNADVYDLEVGAGYRIGPGTILKLAYRRDHWNVQDGRKAFFPEGYSVAAQISYRFDVNSWFERPR